jgi:hypothetical protein
MPISEIVIKAAIIEQQVSSPGIGLILSEYEYQSRKWGDEHDDKHVHNELSEHAAELLLINCDGSIENIEPDSWGLVYKYKEDRLQQLVIAGALVAAEIDRLLRVNENA